MAKSAHRFTTPALAAFAAGQAIEPIGHLPNGRPVYPIAGGADPVVPAEGGNAIPTADDLAAMTDEQVQEALDSALSEASDLQGRADSLSDDELARLESLADFAGEGGVVDTETVRREQVAAERAARVEAAGGRLTRVDPETPADEGTTAPEAEAEAADAGADTAAPEAVAAGGAVVRRPAPRPAPRKVPTPANETASGFAIVASAGLNDFSGGDRISMAQAADAFADKSLGFPQGEAHTPHVRHQHRVASIRRNHTERGELFMAKQDFSRAPELLRAASKESRLAGGSLVAAGGWCAPSTTMYGLTSMATLDGIIDLPTIGVDRGGINFTPGPDFSDVFTDAGFFQTEAEAIAGTTKSCVEVDCPDFDEVRLDAVGHCVKAPLLTRSAYPEAIQQWLELTVIAVQHKIAARLIAGMRTALGTALAPTLTGTPVTWGLLSIVEWVIENQRTAYRLGENETLEVVIPRWVRAAIRADLANRAFNSSARITNAMIQEHFADRGAQVQWVLNYLETGLSVTSVTYPATFEVMVYPAGTFVKGEADVINLDTVYDTADLQTNVYTAAFVEDGVFLAKMQHGGKRITIPTNVNGMMGALQLDDNLFTAQVENAGAAAV